MITTRRFSLAICTTVAALALSACGTTAPASKVIAFKAGLSGANEVPPVLTAASGMVTAKLNTGNNLLTWDLTYTGLSGPATAAHFHGPATAAQNAGVALGFNSPVSSPQSGQAVLTAAQLADLMAGKWYVNVHTEANKPGEIRGQMLAQ
jgi:hypothetical protein